ncbi:MAG: serpin family protein [Lachnospiraceae bacterium]|nr:serpin family protein [Lachnospiraceae bacterium]
MRTKKRKNKKKQRLLLIISVCFLAGLVFTGISLAIGFSGRKEGKIQDLLVDVEAQERAAMEITEEMWESFSADYCRFSAGLLVASMEVAEGEGENICLSPLSAFTALTLIENGAGDRTLEEMEGILAGGEHVEVQNEILCAYLESLVNTEKANVETLHSLWFNEESEGLEIEQKFLERLKTFSQTCAFQLEFAPPAEQVISRWVEENSGGRLSASLQELEEQATLYLFDGISFDAWWREVYQEDQVREALFFSEEGEEYEISMMYGEEERFLSDEDSTGFLKAYEEGYLFFALLPREGISMEEYLGSFTGEKLQKILASEEEATVHTGLPRFSQSCKIQMKDVLQRLGIETVFDEVKADFSGIGEVKNGQIFIQDIFHQTKIAVDTMGTRAASSTEVMVVATSEPERIEEVILNRPFVYGIIDRERRLPLFLGVFMTV